MATVPSWQARQSFDEPVGWPSDGALGLSVAASVYGSIEDTSGQVVYADLTNKVDWAVGLSYLPYRYAGGIRRSLDVIDGTPVIVDQYLLQRQTDASAFAP